MSTPKSPSAKPAAAPQPSAPKPATPRTGTSYAHQNRTSLPGGQPSAYKTAPNMRSNFQDASKPKQGSQMVKKDQPKPAPRPAPHIANGPDRAAFNARWEKERQMARPGAVPVKQVPPLPDRAARKAAFKAKRQAQEQQARAREKAQSRNR